MKLIRVNVYVISSEYFLLAPDIRIFSIYNVHLLISRVFLFPSWSPLWPSVERPASCAAATWPSWPSVSQTSGTSRWQRGRIYQRIRTWRSHGWTNNQDSFMVVRRHSAEACAIWRLRTSLVYSSVTPAWYRLALSISIYFNVQPSWPLKFGNG